MSPSIARASFFIMSGDFRCRKSASYLIALKAESLNGSAKSMMEDFMPPEISKVEIRGQAVKMIEKKCAGCSRTFKISDKSKQKYHSVACEVFAEKKPGVFHFETDED